MKSAYPFKKGLLVTGAAMYAGQSVSTMGAIVHVSGSPVVASTATSGVTTWDIDQDSTTDVTFNQSATFDIMFFNLNGQNLNGFVRKTTDAVKDFRNLGTGFSVKATMAGYSFIATNANNIRVMSTGVFVNPKGFADNVAGNVGFRFNIGGNTHYGWAALTIDLGNPGSLTISEWAYNDTADTGIQVGAVPEPVHTGAALGMLAAGAAGLRRWRKVKMMAA